MDHNTPGPCATCEKVGVDVCATCCQDFCEDCGAAHGGRCPVCESIVCAREFTAGDVRACSVCLESKIAGLKARISELKEAILAADAGVRAALDEFKK